MAHVDSNGRKIWVEESGEGEPLLLVMGLGGQMIDWPDEFVDGLVGSGFRVIRFDNRDVGLSESDDWEPPSRVQIATAMLSKRRTLEVGYRLTDMAADAVGVLAALGIESAHVVGMSMGGMIAQTMAIEYPQMVRSLCSVMSNTGDRKNGGIDRKVLRKMARAKLPSKEEAPEILTEQYSWWVGSAWRADVHLERTRASIERAWNPAGTARQSAAIMASPDRTDALRGLNVPTLVVHGTHDKLVLPSGGVATVDAVPGARLLMFNDMGHDLPHTRNDELIDAIKRNTERAP
jgi:pimeloyl-ACP methyl ester carboxylesterase